MLTVIFFLIIILGLLFNKSKFVRNLQYICIFIVFAFNSWSEDDISYQRIYRGYYGASHEPGFDLLCRICFKNGVPYETFKVIYVSIAVLLLLFALRKAFKDSRNEAYSLLMLYPLLPLVELLRQLMGLAIIAYGMAWYFSHEKENIKNKIIFALIVLLGATFHYSVLFFILLLLTNEKVPQKSTYTEIVAISVVSIILFNIPIFRIVLNLVFASEKVLNWFDTKNRIGLGVFLIMAFHTVSFVIYDFIYRSYFQKTNGYGNEKTPENVDKLSKRMYSLNVYSFALFGLYTYNMEFFSRLYIFVLILNCAHVSAMARKVKSKNVLILRTAQFIFHVVMFVYFCQPFNEDGIMSMILNNNSIFP